jgi:uncharacterized Zn-binding protein involved in type VI secretion
MVTPAVPPIPHVGGPVVKGSAGVLIGGMPAARMGDLAVCTGPPDTIILGCMTVLIGETMAGGGGGGGAGAGTPASVAAHASAVTAQTDNVESTTKEEHWADFEYVDKAGNIISGIFYKFKDSDGKETKSVLRPDGHIKRDALGEGQCEAIIEITAEVEGYEDGTNARIEIYKRDLKEPDTVTDSIETSVKSGKVEEKWEYKYTTKLDSKIPLRGDESSQTFSAPSYYFEVIIERSRARSPLLVYDDTVEIELRDEEDNPVANEEYVLYLSDGQVRKGKLDGNGKAKEEDVPPGIYRVKFPGLGAK